MLDQTKPYLGILDKWVRREIPAGVYYECLFINHPVFGGRYGHTSMVVAEEGLEIETLNSRYTLLRSGNDD